MVDPIKNSFEIVSQFFDTKYNFNCKYSWSLSLEIAENVFLDAPYYRNFNQMLYTWESRNTRDILKNDDLSENYKADELANADVLFDEIRDSGICKWNYEEIICSALFVVFHNKLSLTGRIDSTSWHRLFTLIMSLEHDAENEVVDFIEVNGYFYLDPNFAISGAKDYFKKAIFFFGIEDEEQKKKLINVLTLLQIKDTQIQSLILDTFKNKSFNSIINFLDNYKYKKPEVLTLDKLEFYLNKIELTSSDKIQIVQNICSNLESVKATDLTSTWEELNYSSNVVVAELYQEIYEETAQRKKLKILNKEFFNVVAKLMSLTKIIDNHSYEIILYPPLKIVQSRLSSIPLEDLESLYHLIISEKDVLDVSIKNKAVFSIRQIVLCIIFGTIIAFFTGVKPASSAQRPYDYRGAEAASVSASTEITTSQVTKNQKKAETKAPASSLNIEKRIRNAKLLNLRRELYGKGKLSTGKLTSRGTPSEKLGALESDEFYDIDYNGATIRASLIKPGYVDIYGTYGRYELLKARLPQFAGLMEPNVKVIRADGELDHTCPARLRRALFYSTEQAVAIFGAKRHNRDRTAGQEGLNDLRRDPNITYKSSIEDKLGLVEGASPGIRKSFKRVVSGPTGQALYDERSAQKVLFHLEGSFDQYTNDVDAVFTKPNELTNGYEIMVMEAYMSVNVLRDTANTILQETREKAENTPISSFLNSEIIDEIEKHYEFVTGVKKYIEDAGNSVGSQRLGMALTQATGLFGVAGFDINTHRVQNLPKLVEKQQVEGLLTQLGQVANSQGNFDIDELDQRATSLGLRDHEMAKGYPFTETSRVRTRKLPTDGSSFNSPKSLKKNVAKKSQEAQDKPKTVSDSKRYVD